MDNRPAQMTMEWTRDRMSQLISATGKSDRAFSIEIGQSPSYIYKILKGISNPKWDDFFYVVWILRMQVSDFFDEGLEDPPLINSILEELRGMDHDEQQDILNICQKINKKRDAR